MDDLLEQLRADAATVAGLKDAEWKRNATVRAIFALAASTGQKPPVTRMAQIMGFHVRRVHQIRDGV